MKTISPLLIALLLAPVLVLGQGDNSTGGVTITPADGNFNRCFPDTVVQVKINIPEEYTAVDSFALQWCLDCPFIKIPGSLNPANQTHRYSLSDLRESCRYDASCNFMGVCFTARIFAYIPDKATPDNNSFTLTFRFPPEPDFAVPSTVCEDTKINFENRTCPDNDPSMTYWWDYGNGQADDLGMSIYPDTGRYKVTLTAMNTCDTITRSRNIRALGLPVAEIAFNPGQAKRDTFCINEVISLDGSVSTFATSYRWRISPSSYTILDDKTESSPSPRVVFQESGLYNIHLTVNNSCNVPSELERKILIVKAPVFSLEEQPDACDTLLYTPQPYDSLATYWINGSEPSGFPFGLPASDSAYIVEARMDTECGMLIRRDTFFVDRISEFSIIHPSADTTVCLDSGELSFELEGIDQAGGTWYRNGVAFSPPFLPEEVGDFRISFERGSAACVQKDEVLIQVDGVQIDLEDQFFCEGAAPFLIPADTVEGFFSSSDCPSCISPGGTFDPVQMEGVDQVAIIYTLVNATGCSASKTIAVRANRPDAQFQTDSVFCQDAMIPVDLSQVIADEQTWRIDGAITAPPPFMDLPPGYHDITLSVRIGACSDSAAQTIRIIEPPPLANIVVDQDTSCGPLVANFAVGGVTDPEAAYRWHFNRFPGDTLTGTDVPIQTFANDSFQETEIPVWLSVSNACAETTDTIRLVVKAHPEAIAGTVTDKHCSGDTLEIFNGSRGRIDNFEWQIPDFEPIYDPILPPITLFTDTMQNIPISLAVANECGRDTTEFTLRLEPTNAIAGYHIGKLDFCVGDTIQITNLANTDDVRYYFGNSTERQEPDPMHIYYQEGTYRITQKAFGCGFDSIDQLVHIHQRPKAFFIAPPSTCIGTAVTLANQSENAINQSWWINGVELSHDWSPITSFDSLGTYIIKLEVTSIDGCKHRQERMIQVLPPPSAEFTAPDTICAGAPFELDHSTTEEFLACQWAIDGQPYTDGCRPELTITTPGIHLIDLTVSDGRGCEQTISQSVFIRPTPEAAFEYQLDFSCSPAMVIFNDRSTDAGSYHWSFGNGQDSRESSPVITYNRGGNYRVELIAGRDGICFDTTLQEILIDQTPVAGFQVSDERCFPADEVIITIDSKEDHFIEVTGLDNSYFQSGRDRYEIVQAGDYQVQVVSTAGCDTSFSFSVPPFQEVQLEVMEDTTILFGQSIVIRTQLNTSGMSLSWTPVETLDAPGSPEPLAQPFTSTNYVLEGSFRGCIYRDSVLIKVNTSHILPFAPMAFSPNQDGINDRFMLFGGVGVAAIEKLEIFNRWGGQMFRVDDAIPGDEQAGWDGTFNGNLLPPDVYVFRAEIRLVNGEIVPLSGDVTLVR